MVSSATGVRASPPDRRQLLDAGADPARGSGGLDDQGAPDHRAFGTKAFPLSMFTAVSFAAWVLTLLAGPSPISDSPSEKWTLQKVAEGEFHVSGLDWLALQHLKKHGLTRIGPQVWGSPKRAGACFGASWRRCDGCTPC